MRQNSWKYNSDFSNGRGRTAHFRPRDNFHHSLGVLPVQNPGSMTPVSRHQMRNHNHSFIESFADIVEEEKHEDDDGYHNLRRRQSRFKLIKDQNEFNKGNRRNKSTDLVKDMELDMKPSNLNHHINDVSEDEEEEISDSSLEKQQTDHNKNQKKSKTYSIGYLTKKIWSNKIYSDDFDVDFEVLKNNQKARFKLGSVLNSAIQEDVE